MYRVKTVNQVEFLLPPKAKLGHEGILGNQHNLTFASKFRYHRIFISGLSQHDYAHCILRINQAAYEHDNKAIPYARLSGYYHTTSPAQYVNSYCDIYFLDTQDGCILEVNYEELLKIPDVAAEFTAFALQLFNTFQAREGAPANWPAAICQSLLEKVFELLPVAQSASLARYLAYINEYKSVVLLNPKIGLLVDHTEKVRPKFTTAGNSYWQYNLYGQTLVHFYRDPEGNLMQTPFIRFSRSVALPNNFTSRSAPMNATLQASTADIQLSDILKNKKFMFLYQDNFKANNQQSDPGSCNNAENENEPCNSQLLFTDTASSAFIHSLNPDSPTPRAAAILNSVFGMRNLITPVITLYINNNPTPVILRSSLDVLKQENIVPPVSAFTVYRLYNGSYKKVKHAGETLILLPGDKIKF